MPAVSLDGHIGGPFGGCQLLSWGKVHANRQRHRNNIRNRFIQIFSIHFFAKIQYKGFTASSKGWRGALFLICVQSAFFSAVSYGKEAGRHQRESGTGSRRDRAMRAAVSMKKPSGTMLMSMSVAGSRIHRSLLKKIWWNMMKYLVKSVDMMSPRTVINAKNSPVPMHREGGRTRPILALVAAMRMRKAGSKDQAYPADGQGLQEKDLHVLHMGDFTFIEKLPLFPSHGGGHMEVLPVASEIIHHLIRHMEKIVHGHGRKAVQHIVFGVFLFKISGRPVYHRLHGSDEQE